MNHVELRAELYEECKMLLAEQDSVDFFRNRMIVEEMWLDLAEGCFKYLHPALCSFKLLEQCFDFKSTLSCKAPFDHCGMSVTERFFRNCILRFYSADDSQLGINRP